jgi:hypothetical protein
MTDKFISINYYRADNTRHTVQVEKFYIDALNAIGIDDVARFAAENAGVSQVTRNVKRAIINELVSRATNKQPNELNTIQSTSELNTIQPVTPAPAPAPLRHVDFDNLPETNDPRCTQTTNRNTRCKKAAFKLGYCKVHYQQFMKTRR